MDNSLSTLKGVGPARLKALNENGIFTRSDLLMRLPREYRDLSRPVPISDLIAGTTSAVRAEVVSPATQVFTKRVVLTRALISDGTDVATAIWFNQPWLKQNLPVGRKLLLYGRVEMKGGKPLLSCPSIESEEGLIPVYKPVADIPSKLLRQWILEALDGEIDDPLPVTLREQYGLCDLGEALRRAHNPATAENLHAGLYRLMFENLLMFQLAVAIYRNGARRGIVIDRAPGDEDNFWKTLPFPPTGAQARVLREIAADMRAETAMARLVQGDVGCGKTAVAFGSIFLAARDGWQSAMMAPTEVLAYQHYESALQTLKPLGISVGLLTGSMTPKAHRDAREKIKSGEWDAVFGTHALITENVEYRNLGLVITDEQHRFGVRQRSLLGEKGENPNVLVMSATPIPRTLSLILYGDLDLSVIDEMPPGRIPVKTRIVPEKKRKDMYGFIRNEVKKGRQAYFVCPLVEESEAVDAQSAVDLFEDLKEKAFPDLNVQMVHGKMRAREKDEILEDFRRGKSDILVSTTVIEVGVNVPNATVMVVENAERFGLAQLHQLRGRVGRGTDEAWCFLMADANDKLKIMTETNDGFKIAEKDMELRGPGDMFGTRQSGALLENVMNAATDAQTLKITHELAREIIKRPDGDKLAGELKRLAKKWVSNKGEIALAVN